MLLPIVLIGTFLAVSNEPSTEIPFDSAVWRNTNPERSNKRTRMVNDLIKNHLKRGMTQSEVWEMLGEVTNTHSDSEVFNVYRKRRPLFGEPWGMTLTVQYDSSARVLTATCLQHALSRSGYISNVGIAFRSV